MLGGAEAASRWKVQHVFPDLPESVIADAQWRFSSCLLALRQYPNSENPKYNLGRCQYFRLGAF